MGRLKPAYCRCQTSPTSSGLPVDFRGSGRRRDIDEPGNTSSLDQIFENFLVLQRVHRPPKAVVSEGEQLIVLYQTLERFVDQLFAVPQIVENLSAEDEATAVDPKIRVLGCPDGGNPAVDVHVDEMQTKARTRGHEG